MESQTELHSAEKRPSRPVQIREIHTNSIMVGQPELQNHDTKVELIKENGIVSHIRFICDCGHKTIVKCVYTSPEMQ